MMGFWETVLLGVIAGGTIVLGLPAGRLHRPSVTTSTFLNAAAIGVLTFLLWDVLSAGWEPVDHALGDLRDKGEWGPFALHGGLFVAGLVVSILGLSLYERWMAAGAGTASESPSGRARRMAFLIATGIGLHNLAEGLAIGHASAAGDLALATPLVIGFALHNATEGFGIVAPLNVPDPDRQRPSWGLLLVLALIGGGPTLLGTVIGYGFPSDLLGAPFMSLAAGSILYVVVQLVQVAGRARRNDLLMAGVLLGVLAGFATDTIVSAAGI